MTPVWAIIFVCLFQVVSTLKDDDVSQSSSSFRRLVDSSSEYFDTFDNIPDIEAAEQKEKKINTLKNKIDKTKKELHLIYGVLIFRGIPAIFKRKMGDIFFGWGLGPELAAEMAVLREEQTKGVALENVIKEMQEELEKLLPHKNELED